MRRFVYEPACPRVVFGPGVAQRELAAECDRLGLHRVLLIATAGELARSGAVPASLGGRLAGRFTAVRTHVPVDTAAAAVASAAEVAADGLLCVGGGAATGTAKAVALESGLPIVAVPTTYAGSEVTPVWGLTEGGRKRTGRSAAVLPRTVLYDAELTTGLPAAISAASGMNALAHCVDTLGLHATDPVTALLAIEGVRVLATSLPAVAGNGKDLAARTEALYGAYLAGSAFATAGSGVHHKACHVLGGRFDLPHAATHAVLLPQVAGYLTAVNPETMERVRLALDPSAASAATALHALAGRIGAPLALRDLGLSQAGLAEAIREVAEHTGLAEVDASRILRAAWHGATPESAGSPGDAEHVRGRWTRP